MTQQQLEYQRAWRKKNPEKLAAANKRWRDKNPERVKEYARTWSRRNRRKQTEYSRRWRMIHPEQVKVIARRSGLKRLQFWKTWIRRKKNHPCADCGFQFPSYVMHFDHVRGHKLFNVSTVLQGGISLSRAEAEVMKCDVICANCHAERTWGPNV
jgi:hypothetical protein